MADPNTLSVVFNVLYVLRMKMQVTCETNPLFVIDQFAKDIPSLVDDQGHLLREHTLLETE